MITSQEAEALRDDNRQLPATAPATMGWGNRGNTQPPAPVGTLDEATPRPWVVDNDSGIYYVVAPDVALIATLDPSDDDAPAQANAELIVEAVNTYTTNQQRIAELEAALWSLLRHPNGHNKVLDDCGSECPSVAQARTVLNRKDGD